MLATAAPGAVPVIRDQEVGPDSLAFALSATLAVIAWTVLLPRLLQPSLSGRWFRPAAWEREGRIWRAAEWAHLLGFGVVSVLALGFGWSGRVRGGALLVAVGIVLHLYPALLQRRVRPRVQRVLAWRERRRRR